MTKNNLSFRTAAMDGPNKPVDAIHLQTAMSFVKVYNLNTKNTFGGYKPNTGSGVIVRGPDLVLTACHVVEDYGFISS
jgi:hypothetical protein